MVDYRALRCTRGKASVQHMTPWYGNTRETEIGLTNSTLTNEVNTGWL